MAEQPLVTIVVVLTDFFHLIPYTFKSILSQTFNSYEIIVIEKSPSKKDLQMLKPFVNKIKTIIHTDSNDLTAIMNKGLSLAEGRFLHFLFSGDTYISHHVMGYLNDLIKEKEELDLISCAFLKREEMEPPQSVTFSFEYFKMGKIPMHIQSCWYCKKTLDELKGFDQRYYLQAGFDIICRIFLKKNKKVLFSNRVLTDYEFKKKPTSIMLRTAWENLFIIYRNFGIIKTIFWWFVHDHFRMLKLWLLSFKKAFFNR